MSTTAIFIDFAVPINNRSTPPHAPTSNLNVFRRAFTPRHISVRLATGQRSGRTPLHPYSRTEILEGEEDEHTLFLNSIANLCFFDKVGASLVRRYGNKSSLPVLHFLALSKLLEFEKLENIYRTYIGGERGPKYRSSLHRYTYSEHGIVAYSPQHELREVPFVFSRQLFA
ncbi:hypothetical protein BC938DRAFT_472595 [Jimgerdemannia flammicorona]|uniref:Uncharacterized protein n=1 Tax=Jimgerdemannia flammicorona TaxID=994334 RepID=A0A433Q5S7_9FUNG|nr:hypothetical protein BC938DRAFT_472595 [Jimgerdemannia flammicorona]